MRFTGFELYKKIDWAHRSLCIYLVWPPLPVDRCAWPGTSPHHTEPLSWPPPLTAGSHDSTSLRHIPRDHVNDHGHRTCNTNHVVKGERKLTLDYIQQILTTLENPKSKAVCLYIHIYGFLSKFYFAYKVCMRRCLGSKRQMAYMMHSRGHTAQQVSALAW